MSFGNFFNFNIVLWLFFVLCASGSRKDLDLDEYSVMVGVVCFITPDLWIDVRFVCTWSIIVLYFFVIFL